MSILITLHSVTHLKKEKEKILEIESFLNFHPVETYDWSHLFMYYFAIVLH